MHVCSFFVLAQSHTEGIKQAVDVDGASLFLGLVERLIADAEMAGLALSDLEPELGHPEVLIRARHEQ